MVVFFQFRVYVSDFNQCDVTDTGSLNKEEALTLAKHQLGRHVTPEECEAWVEEMGELYCSCI